MDQPANGQSPGAGEERSGSVSSLASRFEQLAASSASSSASSQSRQPYTSSKNGSSSSLTASAPPSSGPPPVKRPKPVTARSFPLQEQAARLEIDDSNRRYQASSEATSPTELTFRSGISSSRRDPSPSVPAPQVPVQPVLPNAAAQRQRTESSHSQNASSSKAAPPIPHATRPVAPSSSNTSTTPAFAYNFSLPQSTSDITAPRPTSPKRSRTPPPVPASRRSRPNTPSTSHVEAPSINSSMVVEVDKQPSVLHSTTHTVASGVSAIAHKFGHAKPSKSYASSPSAASTRQTSPESRSPSGHPGHPFDPHSASRALQHMVAESSSSGSSPSGHLAHSVHPSPLRPLSALDGSSSARSATPPPKLPRSAKAGLEVLEASTSPPSSENLTQSTSLPPRQSSLPPALPKRDRSNSVQSRENSFREPSSSLAPPLPSRSLPEATGRPRAATTVDSGPLTRHANGPIPPKRETISVPAAASRAGDTYIPLPPPVRNLQSSEARSAPTTPSDRALGTHGHQFQRNAADGTLDSSSSGSEEDPGEDKKVSIEMPDASFANRRPPYVTPERKLLPKHSVYAFAVHGRYAISATTHLRIWDTWTGETTGVITLQGENKIVAVEFVFTDAERGRDGRIAWAGSKDGNLFEVDIQTLQVLETKTSAHASPIAAIYRAAGNRVVTVCDSGKVQMWSNDEDPDAAPSLSSTPRTQRLADKHCFLKCFDDQLWSCHGPLRQSTISSHLSSNATRSPTIRVYGVTAEGATSLTTRAMHPLDNGCPVGPVMAGTMIPCEPNLVYLAHETGHISIWDKTALQCVNVVRISPYAITAVEGVNDLLWTGNREGSIHVYDTKHTPWKVAKAWKASDEPICGLQVDLATLGTVSIYGTVAICLQD